jgi:hypothetical protein
LLQVSHGGAQRTSPRVDVTPGPDEEIRRLVSNIDIIGDAREVQDIFGATRAGYQLALKY